ncbi:electron transfer flavoprotein subunit beta/FixA family protein [Streptomyces chartreusis]|uniref:electron transfer flavoprotein subunit beta/FixA family protein n=1 Tax=Streptomyces chartreusis TaxID=1969 RepID=UPI003662EF4A
MTMNVVVCVKYVPDATAERHFEADNTVDREGADGLLSELDEYAVEQALQIKENTSADVKVTVLSVGPEDAESAVRKALQMGADQGVHVMDDVMAGSDAMATSLVLAEAIKKLPYDLVICGMGSTDGAMGVMPAMLSERLGVPGLTLGSEISVDGCTVRIRRDSDAATTTVEGELPLVASVTDQSGEARYPSFKGIMAAKKKPVETWSLADLGVDASQVGLSASWTAVASAEPRPPRMQGEVVTDEDGSGAAALVEFLASKKFI